MGDLYAAQTGGVGFPSSPGEGAATWEAAAMKPRGAWTLYASQTV